jgi:hypothetical protein
MEDVGCALAIVGEHAEEFVGERAVAHVDGDGRFLRSERRTRY